jgi:putative NADPH-quinone reductase
VEISVIIAHPEPHSFNHAIAKSVCGTLEGAGHTVRYHDLYREGFDPLLPAAELDTKAAPGRELASYCEELRRSEGLVIIHPNWWGQPPAAMKGWIDRVFRPGVAYRFLDGDGGEGVPVGLLRAETAIVFNTSNTPKEREMEIFGDPLDRLWRRCILEFCGVKRVIRENFGVVITSTPEERAAWLDQVAAIVAESFPSDRAGRFSGAF